MNNDIRPPQKLPTQPTPASQPAPVAEPEPTDAPAASEYTGDIQPQEETPPKKLSTPKKSRRWLWWIVLTVFAVIAASVTSVALWYNQQLDSLNPNSKQLVNITVSEGTSGSSLGDTLESEGVIRNSTAFSWYLRLNGNSSQLQAGVYKVGPGQTVPEIVEIITSGETETFRLTFLPGDTLEEHRKVFIKAGYEASVVDAALEKTYGHPLLKTKPKSADLEGYIYGETYEFFVDATPEQILTRTFDEMYKVIVDNDLEAKYKKQGLSLFEGITLASIIQREVNTPADQAQVAQVFLLRMKRGMQLGSDVTYQYIADKTGQERDVNLDSPYNTRRYAGLPPGPISSPGETALVAVGNPAKGDYVYFLSGDDDKTYFAKTNAEHEANIKNHCEKKCQIL